MTVNEIVEKVARLKPSGVQDGDVAAWVLALDGRLRGEVGMDGPGVTQWPEEGDVPLCVPAPYDELYLYYAQGMVEFARREYNEYNNSISLYNDAVGAWRRAWRREHVPPATQVTGLW